MSTTRILNQAQAEAVYSAMCALNNVGGEISSIGLRDKQGLAISVQVTRQGLWCVLSARHASEWHDNQSAFAAAYGLTAANAAEQREAVQVVTEFATSARKQYAATKELTCQPDGSCQTIRVPVALLNRIRDMADLFGFPRA